MDKISNDFQETLAKLLQDEISCASSLFQSLENERAALSGMDEELINANSANKQKLLESLQQASKTRIDLMSGQGFSATPSGIKEYLISKHSDSTLEGLFLQLSEIAQQCFTENRLVGQLINRRTQFISQALSSLSPSANLQGLTYEKNGNTTNINQLQSLYSI